MDVPLFAGVCNMLRLFLGETAKKQKIELFVLTKIEVVFVNPFPDGRKCAKIRKN